MIDLIDLLREKSGSDPRLRSVLKRIENGAADFSDTAIFSERYSALLGKVLSGNVLDLSAEEREELCCSLLQESYNEQNELLAEVQNALDEKSGISIRPQKAAFPLERVQQLAHSLVDPTVPDETIQRRAGSGAANISMSFHDNYMKENAKFRNDAGLKCYITRMGTSCCPWCSEVAGRFRFGDQPDDIFRRHDNCDCTIIYDNQVLRGRSSADGGRTKTWEQIGDVPTDYQPTVFTQEQAKALEQRNLSQFKGLTNGENSGKIKAESELGKFKENIRNDDRMSKEYYTAVKDKFSHGSDDAKALFNKYVNGDSVENAAYIGTAHFNPDSKKISMNYYADLHNIRGKCVTWFHEHGHFIDDAMNNVSNNKEFRQYLTNDWLSYMKMYGKEHNIKTFDKVQTAISKDLSSMRKHSAVSDIFEGVSKGGIRGCAGHPAGYWKDDSLICSEAFAHMFEAQFDKTRYNEMQKYFPSALSKFEEMIKEGAK